MLTVEVPKRDERQIRLPANKNENESDRAKLGLKQEKDDREKTPAVYQTDFERDYWAVQPPSMRISVPVMKPASSEHR